MDAPKPEENEVLNTVDFINLLANLRTSSSDFSGLNNELKHSNYNPEEYWYQIGSRLLIMFNTRLYRTGGFRSFSDYCAHELGYSRQHVYKLMRVVQFIDNLWAQAENQDQCKNVQRLFTLGFTKLYLLHYLETSRLEHLLNKGITITVNDIYPERQVRIEEATVGQLRRALGREPAIKAKGNRARERAPIYKYKLIPLLKSQSHFLLQLIENCQQEIVDQEKLKEQLQVMREYTESIVEIIDVLTSDLPPDTSARK